MRAEAAEQSTLVAILEPDARPLSDASLTNAVRWQLDASEPTVAELSALRHSLDVVSPDGFGGSDGFGQAPGLAYGREPIACRCVVLVTTLQETAAAIGAGMRTVALPRIEGDWIDEDLDGIADVCLDALGEEGDPLALRASDLTTPGAYWLNPSLPRDIHGGMVDPETGEPIGKVTTDAGEVEAARLLADMEER